MLISIVTIRLWLLSVFSWYFWLGSLHAPVCSITVLPLHLLQYALTEVPRWATVSLDLCEPESHPSRVEVEDTNKQQDGAWFWEHLGSAELWDYLHSPALEKDGLICKLAGVCQLTLTLAWLVSPSLSTREKAGLAVDFSSLWLSFSLAVKQLPYKIPISQWGAGD